MVFNGHTHVVGVIGHPITHTVSPSMHHAAYDFLGLNYAFVPFDVAPNRLAEAVAGIRALSLVGVNVTVPYKESVIPYLDDLDPVARQIGAVNVICNVDGRLIGYNTDGDGFVASAKLCCDVDFSGKKVVIIGAGGAAKGIAFAMLAAGISELTILNRTRDRAEALVAQLTSGHVRAISLSEDLSGAYEALRRAHIVVQTTPVGMRSDESPLVDFSWVIPGQVCVDIIYRPKETLFLKEAEEAGARILNGEGMLAGQGQLAFRLFTGQDVPFEIMYNSVISN